MACPFFRPAERFEDGVWLKPPRLPLGDPCRGACTADGLPFEPAIEVLREMCNAGYARGRCPRFPVHAQPDAVRFSVALDHGGTVGLIFILEKDYAPLRHGAIEYDAVAERFTTPVEDVNLMTQARYFVEGYLQRRTKV